MTSRPANENDPKNVGGTCPICRKPTNPTHRPFCSKRCSDVDLNRWLSGAYAVPVAEDENGPERESRDDGGT